MSEPDEAGTPDQGEPGTVEGVEAPAPGGWAEVALDELAIRDERRTAQDLVRRVEQGRFLVDPDFQGDLVWDRAKQSRLVESVLLRIPLPVFYVAEDEQGRLVVVDGRQRLTALQRFFSGELRLDLPDRPELHGKGFADLEARLQNRVEDCPLLFYVIDHSVPERALLDIVERVNGGEVLTRQQMRNALHHGPATQLLAEEASSELFRAATGGSLDPRRMQDRELINRFASFALLPLDEYRGDMDGWLAQGLRRLAELPDAERDALREKLRRGLRNNLAVFGKQAFRRHDRADQRRGPINAALFDVMTAGLAGVDEARAEAAADRLRAAFYQRMADPAFDRALTEHPDAAETVQARFAIARAMFQEVLDVP